MHLKRVVVGAERGSCLGGSDLCLRDEGFRGRRNGGEVVEPQGRSTILVRGLGSHVAVVSELISRGEWVYSRQSEQALTYSVNIADAMDKVREMEQLFITVECVRRIDERVVGVNVVEEGGDVVINGDKAIAGWYSVTDDAI